MRSSYDEKISDLARKNVNTNYENYGKLYKFRRKI